MNSILCIKIYNITVHIKYFDCFEDDGKKNSRIAVRVIYQAGEQPNDNLFYLQFPSFFYDDQGQLQCVKVNFSVSRSTAVCQSQLQCVKVNCSVSRLTARCQGLLQGVNVKCRVSWSTAGCQGYLQGVTVNCSV